MYFVGWNKTQYSFLWLVCKFKYKHKRQRRSQTVFMSRDGCSPGWHPHFNFPLFSEGVGECQGGETTALYVRCLPPPERHKDPKSSTSPLGSRKRQETNPLRHHHTGSDPTFKTGWRIKKKKKRRHAHWQTWSNTQGFCFLFCLFLSFRSAGWERSVRGNSTWTTGARWWRPSERPDVGWHGANRRRVSFNRPSGISCCSGATGSLNKASLKLRCGFERPFPSVSLAN